MSTQDPSSTAETMRLSASTIRWARTSATADSLGEHGLGLLHRGDGLSRWCVYDAGEDDPPIFECDFVDEAQALVEILRFVAAQGDGSNDAR